MAELFQSQAQILQNLSAVLEQAGSSFELVNKVNIFLVEPSDFGPMNDTYVSFFSDFKPVRYHAIEVLSNDLD